MRHFSASELRDYRTLKRRRQTNDLIGKRWRRTAAEVDIALNALLGREEWAAADALNKREAVQ
jgi:hypothetical protein